MCRHLSTSRVATTHKRFVKLLKKPCPLDHHVVIRTTNESLLLQPTAVRAGTHLAPISMTIITGAFVLFTPLSPSSSLFESAFSGNSVLLLKLWQPSKPPENRLEEWFRNDSLSIDISVPGSEQGLNAPQEESYRSGSQPMNLSTTRSIA